MLEAHRPIGSRSSLAVEGNAQTSWLDMAFASFALVIYGSAIVPPLARLRGLSSGTAVYSDPAMAACQYLILVVLLSVLIKRRERILPLLQLTAPCLLIVVLCALSVTWSDYPFSTFRRSITLGTCVMFGVYCYDAFGLSSLVRLVSRLVAVLALLSLVVYVLVPDIGREPTGEMRGIFVHKNRMAHCMLLGIACFSYQAIEVGRITRSMIFALMLYACIFICRSMSSFGIATLVLIITGWIVLAGKPRARLVFVFLTSSACAVVLAGALLMPDEVFEILGRDASLTGRLPLWDVVIQLILERPWLGYGYAAFWNPESDTMQYLWLQVGWPAPHSHNGYLDIWLQIGIIGLILYCWLWTRIICLAFKAWWTERQPVAGWILLFMLINLLANLDEGPLPWADEFTALVPPALITMELWNRKYKFARATRMTSILDAGILGTMVSVPVAAGRSSSRSRATDPRLSAAAIGADDGR